MASVTLKKTDGSDAGSVELAAEIFEAPQNEVLVREALNAYLGNQRQGTHATKSRGEVRGGGRKPWKQKGTGRARAGTIRSPLWRGGCIVFGPQPRDYRTKFNTKKRKAAFRAVLSSRVSGNALIVVDDFDLSAAPRTKNLVEQMDKLGTEGRVLIITSGSNELLIRSARNLQWVDVVPAVEVNFYDVLVADTVILTKGGLDAIQEAAK